MPPAEQPDSGLRSITVRRICLGIVVLSLVAALGYQHDFEQALLWYLAFLIYGTVIAGAIQHVYRDVRVGRAETTAMITTTVVFALATLLGPRPVGVTRHSITRMVRVSDNPFPIPHITAYSTPVYNSPLLALFGHRPSMSAHPWFAFALALALLCMAGVCAQWVLVWRLGRHRSGVFNPAVGGAGRGMLR